MSKVIIAGPRDLAVEPETITAAIDASGFEIFEVVSGGAKGVDYCGELWAKRYNFGLRRFFANWRQHGTTAGPIRNREMAEYADALIVIRRPGEYTPGASSMIREAKKAGIPVYIHEVEEAMA